MFLDNNHLKIYRRFIVKNKQGQSALICCAPLALSRRNRGMTAGFLILVAGLFWLGLKAGWIPFVFGYYTAPGFLIVLGLLFILKAIISTSNASTRPLTKGDSDS